MKLMTATKQVFRYLIWYACLFPTLAFATQPRGMVGSPVYHSNYYQPAYSSSYDAQAAAGGYAPASHYQSQYRPAGYPSAMPAGYPNAQANYAPQPYQQAPQYRPTQYQPAQFQQVQYPPQYQAQAPAQAAYYAPPAGYAPAAYPQQQGFTINVPQPRPTTAYRVTYPGGDGYTAYAPQVAYRPVQSQVTYLRPVTVYDPITARQVVYYAPCTGNTCYQAPAVAQVPVSRCGQPAYATPAACGVAAAPACGAPSGCGSQSKGLFGGCKLFNCKLFNGGLFNRNTNTCYSGTCAPAGCGPVACAPAGCGVPYTGIPAGCGGAVAQPYYNPAPAATGIPVISAPAAPITVAPTAPRTTIAPYNSVPGARIPPPGTRAPGSLGPAPITSPATGFPGGVAQPPATFTPSPGAPADAAPSLNTTPNPNFVPSGAGAGVPATTPNFSSNYAPATSVPAYGQPATGNGYGTAPYEGSSVPSRTLQGQGSYPGAVAPAAGTNDGTPATRSSVKPFADPDRSQEPKQDNAAPQLLDPRDRTARVQGAAWPVVPAKWPTRSSDTSSPSSTIMQPRQTSYREMSHRPVNSTMTAPADDMVPVATPTAVVDDSGWTSSL